MAHTEESNNQQVKFQNGSVIVFDPSKETLSGCPVSRETEYFDSGVSDAYDVEDYETALDLLPATKLSFRVTDADSASWVVRKLIELDNRQARVEAQLNKEMQEIERERVFFQRRFGGQLEAWTRENLEGAKKKSVRLPDGTVGFRAQQMKVVVTDSNVALEWARKNAPELIKTVESVSKTKINELVKSQGLVPDGCEIEPPRETFYVK